MSATKGMREIPLGMSNFDHTIDAGLEEALRQEPGDVYGTHAAWNFNGRVWFAGGMFHEEVWRYGGPIEVLRAETLQDVKDAACAQYGAE